MQHGASVDLEDWYYDVEAVEPPQPEMFRDAFERQLRIIIEILERSNTRCTFFVLGKTAERYPEWVRELHASGHEIATHGYGHQHVSRLTPEAFRDDLQRSIDSLEQITGERPIGYRAPYFSFIQDEAWFYDILTEAGLHYSSSVLPFGKCTKSLHLNNVERNLAQRDHQHKVLEIPLAAASLVGRWLPVAGGGYWRLLPKRLILRGLDRIVAKRKCLVIYVHPHEFDPVGLSTHRGLKRRLYVNLWRSTMPGKFRSVLERYSFGPLRDLISEKQHHQ